MNTYGSEFQDRMRGRLLGELHAVRLRLGTQFTSIGAPGPSKMGEVSTLEGGLFDCANVLAEHEERLEAKSRLLVRLTGLARAYERLELGGYGDCQECGEGIPPKRLEAIPETGYCVRCQERQEGSLQIS